MSSEDDFFDNDLDLEFLNEVDAIEAAVLPPQKPDPIQVVEILDDSDDFDMSMNFNDEELEKLDNFIQDSYQGKAVPAPGPPRLKQTTLWGQPSSGASLNSVSKIVSSGNRGFGKPSRKTKVWDRTAFAKSGWKKLKAKRKGDEENGEEPEEEVEFDQFPAPFISSESSLFLVNSSDIVQLGKLDPSCSTIDIDWNSCLSYI
jgi:ATP-dependent DNA helicase MPH1